MTENDRPERETAPDAGPLSYVALITVTLPDAEQPSQLTVWLEPPDPVALASGQVKPLRDCTLAELQHFADAAEGLAANWQQHRGTSIGELALDGKMQLSIQVEGLAAEAAPAESWLDYAVAAPETGEAAWPSLIPHPDEEPVVAEAEAAEPAPLQAEREPVVTVAESEPVFAEREAAPADVALPTRPVPARPRLRILGKRRPLNHPTWTAVDILINEPAFRDAQAHALTSPDREVAGVLIGPPPEKQPDSRYLVHVTETIVAQHTRMHGASVTYTPESWRYVNDRLGELYPDETAVIIGWYHTHPGFGVFLSGMDRFIHHNFFTQVWHVALVLDPLARRSGFFCWDRQKSRVDSYDFPWPDWAPSSW